MFSARITVYHNRSLFALKEKCTVPRLGLGLGGFTSIAPMTVDQLSCSVRCRYSP